MPAASTLTTVNGLLKEVYEGDINDQLQNEKVLMKRVESSSEGVFENAGGKYVVFPLRTKRNAGISYRAENGALAAAGAQGFVSAQETLRYGYGRVSMSGQLMELAKTNPQAFAQAADAEMNGLKTDLIRDSNRIAWGNNAQAYTGILAVCTAVTTAAVIVTAPTTGIIEVGMIVDLCTAATGVPIAAARTVVAALPYSTTFTVSGANFTLAVGDTVVRQGNTNAEPYGVLNLVAATGTLHNINSATAGNEYWRSNVDASTTTLTEVAMIKSCDAIRRATGNGPSAIFASLGCRRSYFNLCTALRRYNEPKSFSGGLIGLAFNYDKEIPVVSDVDAPTSTMIYLSEDQIKEYRTRPWYWADDDNSVLKYVHDYDAWEALMKQYWQIVTHQRNAHAIMTTVTEV